MKALVTGGGGFLGSAIVRQLVEMGAEVRSVSRNNYPELERLGVEHMQGDIGQYPEVARAVAGCDVVFHCAALAAAWGTWESFYQTNVAGTEDVIAACREGGIKKLVYTSSPSVTFSGEDEEGVDESRPYPEKFYAHYPKTKALAEQLVLSANDGFLAVTALRPHIIWGPGDNNPIFNVIVQKAKAGKLRIVGDGLNLIDTTYVEDAARAHIQAAAALHVGSAVAGNAYYLSQGDPRPFGKILNMLLAAANLPPVNSHINPRVAYAAGWALENVYRCLKLEGEPTITRFQALIFSRAHWYTIEAAKRDFGFQPQVTIEEGMENLRQSLVESST